MYLTVMTQLLIMAIIALVSFFFSKANKYGEKEASFLSKVLLMVINPCVMVNAYNIDFDMEKLKATGFSVFISLIFHLVMTVLAVLFIRTAKPRGLLEKASELGDWENRKVFDGLDRIAVVFTNSGFIGIPLIKGVFGDEGVFYLMGYILVFNVYLWTWGDYLMTHKVSIKKIVTNPNILAAFLGVILFCIPGKLPLIIGEPIRMIADLNGAVSMILLGLLFAKFKKSESSKGSEYVWRIIRVVLMRLVVLPVALLGIMLLLTKAFHSYPNIQMIMCVLYTAVLCPVGMSVSGFAVLFGKDSSYSSLLVSISSACCIATVPAFVQLADMLIQRMF